ncbi:hypothetical protein Mucpa_2823 [Mucilaginibacter paludis DSM 18603]|uniref:Uncharacterized protein n=1 Tax=Mucilaginibacter paludis DSM 18603 TaxID=714943 RepID=H1Y8R2_9SPHI|nr:hypothetical protein Mucpa_2823 [Mucilaginibacter paludis DSM 18603]
MGISCYVYFQTLFYVDYHDFDPINVIYLVYFIHYLYFINQIIHWSKDL